MALRAAKNLGCDVPPEAIELAVDYIRRCQDPATGGFRYHPGGAVTPPCSGTSILALEICGKELHHCPEVLKAGNFLMNLSQKAQARIGWGSAHFSYGMYYYAQAMFQLGDNYWAGFRPFMHQQLLPYQDQRTGGWTAADGGSRQYGANYNTAMAVLALTVEYRYLPIYQRGEEPTEPTNK
jgi:hypothetical protein